MTGSLIRRIKAKESLTIIFIGYSDSTFFFFFGKLDGTYNIVRFIY